ncbi:peptidoglycan editing factor PgeF [Clostridium minihomine]|uniref:peptidoglycan editing factor PgeF n=1 Tax=Clostridium minihomine TaxID=2045012 RepID=UPI000C777B41|nr:peptidoglycan editing factor PgeF [Clostridium minihomine]
MQLNHMEQKEKNGVSYLTFPVFDHYPQLLHSFSTRLGGVSQGEFESLNLNFRPGDARENVLENYRRICDAVGYSFDGLVSSAQDHHTVLRRVTNAEKGIGFTRPRDMPSVDGLYTNVPGITLVTSYADCVPLYFFDPVKRVIGLAHAGWRGTVQRIGEIMTNTLQKEFGCNPQDLLAAVGPSIGPCCYEVDDVVRDQVMQHEDLIPLELMKELGGGKYLLDLWECNRRILVLSGIPDQNITVGEVCTKCHPELFFSHRLMGDKRGGMTAMMALKEAHSFDS